MATEIQNTAGSKKLIWTGRLISGVVVLMLIFSAIMKLMKPTAVTENSRG
jgi:hypothetical protein